MKRTYLYFLIVFAVIANHAWAATKTAKEQVIFNKAKSTFGFLSGTSMLGIKTDVSGKFNDFNVMVTKALALNQSSVTINIVSASVDTDNQKRDKHLQNKDFFLTSALFQRQQLF